jgi:hypothetical protein
MRRRRRRRRRRRTRSRKRRKEAVCYLETILIKIHSYSITCNALLQLRRLECDKLIRSHPAYRKDTINLFAVFPALMKHPSIFMTAS